MTMSDYDLAVMLDNALDTAANEIFEPSLIAAMKEDGRLLELRAETLGILVSKSNDYDGEQVGTVLFRALYAGLQDANWSHDAGVAFGIAEQLRKEETTVGIVLGSLSKITKSYCTQKLQDIIVYLEQM